MTFGCLKAAPAQKAQAFDPHDGFVVARGVCDRVVNQRAISAPAPHHSAPSARHRSLDLSEIRQAIIDCIDDPEDLRDLAQVSRVWRAEIAYGQCYKKVIRRLLIAPNYASRRAAPAQLDLPPLSLWPGPPEGYSYLGLTLLMLQLKDDPQKLSAQHAAMRTFLNFLRAHCPKTLVQFEQYKDLSERAIGESRATFRANLPLYAIIGSAWAMQTAVVSLALGVLVGCRPDERGVHTIGLPLFVSITLWVTHAALAELGEHFSCKHDIQDVFARRQRALSDALHPRSTYDVANAPVNESIVKRLLIPPGANVVWPGLPDDYTYLDVVNLLHQVQQNPSALYDDKPEMVWFRNFLEAFFPAARKTLDDYARLARRAAAQSRKVLYANIAAYSAMGLAWSVQIGILLGALVLARSAPIDTQGALGGCMPILMGATFIATYQSTRELEGLLKDGDDVIDAFERYKRAYADALRYASTQCLLPVETDTA